MNTWLEIAVAVPIILVVGWFAGPAVALLSALTVVAPELLSWERARRCFPGG